MVVEMEPWMDRHGAGMVLNAVAKLSEKTAESRVVNAAVVRCALSSGPKGELCRMAVTHPRVTAYVRPSASVVREAEELLAVLPQEDTCALVSHLVRG